MKNRIQLHQLIHKLSKGEKRACKLHLQKYKKEKDQKMVQLFDLLNKMPTYNEEKLLKIFTKELLTYYLHRLKNSLLNALSNLHYKEKNISVGEIINRIELGFKYENLGLIEEYLKKGLEIAEKEHHTPLKLHLLEFQNDLYYKQKRLTKLNETNQQIQNLTNQRNEEALYRLLWGEVMAWKKMNLQKEAIEPLQFSSPELSELFNAPLNEKTNDENKILYLRGKRIVEEVNHQCDIEKLLEIEEQIYAIQSSPSNELVPEMRVLHNIITLHLVLGKLDEAKAILKNNGFFQLLEEEDFQQPTESLPQLGILWHYFVYIEDYDSILKTEPIMLKIRKDAEEIIYNQDSINYQILMLWFIVSCFKKGLYDKCLDWIKKCKDSNTEPTKSSSIFFTANQFIEFCTHLELGNLTILPSLLNAIEYTVKTKNTFKIREELEIIRIFKAILKQNSFSIDYSIFNSGPFSFYQMFFPYLEEKQKELAVKP